MSDVVLKFPVREGEEARLFGSFLSRFIEGCAQAAEQLAADNDAPYVMVRSDPQPDGELKVLIFQQPRAASAFESGWAEVCTGLASKA